METNQFFSIKRFCLLLKNDLRINYKTYLITIVGATLVGFMIFYISMPKKEYFQIFTNRSYIQIILVCLFGLGVFIGLSFPEMNNKIKASTYLLLPASTFEKFLVQFTLRYLGGIALFILIIWMDAHLARWVILRFFEKIDASKIEVFNVVEFFKNDKPFTNVYLIFALLSLGAYLFSIRLFFKKNALVKTVISFGLLVYIMFCLMVLFTHLFYPETTGFRVNLNEYDLIFLPVRNVELWMSSIMILSAFFLLPLGYYKLKEKQV